MFQLKTLYAAAQKNSAREATMLRKRASREENHQPASRLTYKTWGSYCKTTLKVTTLHARTRIRVYKNFTREELSGASLDFSAAFHLASQSVADRKYWIQQAKKRVVTLHDIQAVVDGANTQPASKIKLNKNKSNTESSKRHKNSSKKSNTKSGSSIEVSSTKGSSSEDSGSEDSNSEYSAHPNRCSGRLRASKRQPSFIQNNRYIVILSEGDVERVN